jgi:hypothetical protein
MKRLQRIWSSWMIKLVKEPKWTTVFQSADEYMVSIQKLKLEDAEIPVIEFNQQDSSYNAFGYIYLQVPTELIDKATQIIDNE